MKKILFVIGSLRTGGAEKVCIGLLNEFYVQGYDVSLVVLNLKESELMHYLNQDIVIHNLKVKHARNSFFQLKNLLSKLDVSICLSFTFQLSVQLVLLKRIYKYKYEVFSRGINTFSKKIENESSFRHKYINPFIIKTLYKKSDYFIAQSIGMKLDMIKTLNVDQRKIRVINNPYFSLIKESRKSLISEVKCEKSILFVGSFKTQKNIAFLLEVMYELSLQRKDFVFNIVGDGDLRSVLEEKSRSLGIERIVCFHGFSNDPSVFYNNADVFVLGSLYEGFPNVLLEALSYGVPIVSIDCMSGPSDIIEDSINGFLVSKYDATLFSQTISKSLDKEWDEDLIKLSIEKFKLERIFKQYKNYLLNE